MFEIVESKENEFKHPNPRECLHISNTSNVVSRNAGKRKAVPDLAMRCDEISIAASENDRRNDTCNYLASVCSNTCCLSNAFKSCKFQKLSWPKIRKDVSSVVELCMDRTRTNETPLPPVKNKRTRGKFYTNSVLRILMAYWSMSSCIVTSVFS